ncbi:MAG: NnrS family protein [Burkholderiales bacterium]|uniref:NnrS family protein n=1 Tax=Roseateles sp. TaxID=1971397 RepID=UPI000FB27C3C|nr:MAG: NnrS family protein [Burkholderiales bacterium]
MKSLPLLGQAPSLEPHGVPLLRLGFRPFYLLAALAGALLMPLWWAVFTGRLAPASGLEPVSWHAHEMLFGMVAAVVVGFLFTAGKTWTGLPTPRGGQLAFFALLWLAARIAAIVAPYDVFFTLDVAFLPLVAALFADLVVRARNFRNLGVAAVLGLLGAANHWFHLGAGHALPLDPARPLHAAVALFVVLETVIAGRVIPFFTRNVTPGLQNTVSASRERVVMVATLSSLTAWLLQLNPFLTATLLAVAAVLHAWRLHSWRPAVTLGRPILWSLHLAYAWLPVGFALLAVQQAVGGSASPALHAFTVGATGGLVLAMMTRTARGHTGRPLIAGPMETLAYALIAIAAVLRVGVPLLVPSLYACGIGLAGACFALACCVYLVAYTPMLCMPRVDGQDG